MRIATAVFMTLNLFLLASRPGAAADQKYRLFDQLSDSNWEDAMARADYYAIQLQSEPDSVGVIIVYGGQNRKRGEAQAWGECLKDYLLNRRGISADRIVLLNGGYRQSLTMELWISISKEFIPKPAPTIGAGKVKFRRGKIKSWRSLCNI